MKKLITVLFFLVLWGQNYCQEKLFDGFDKTPADTSYWKTIVDYSATDTIRLKYLTSPVKFGEGALQFYYKLNGHDDWGGFLAAEHWNPDPKKYYDFSGWDSLSFWYYNDRPVSDTLDMILRFCLFDASNSPNKANTYSAKECEKYFSFLDILKAKPGWNYISIPLVNNDNVSGKGFALRTWGGCQEGNSTLDLDKIKGWVLEFVINTQEEPPIRGSFIIDHLALKGLGKQAMVFFNGKVVPGNVEMFQGRAGSVAVTNEQTSNPATHQFSLKWNTPGQWDGPIFTYDRPIDLKFHWDSDTLKFKVKAPAGFGDLRLVLANPDEHMSIANAYGFEAAYLLKADDIKYDGSWKNINIPLKNFDRYAGVWVDSAGITVPGIMDISKVYQLKVLVTNDTRGQGKTVYLDEIWTGNPVFDVMPPAAVKGVAAIAGKSTNMVSWQDVPGEKNEKYDVYYSLNPITKVDAPGVEVVKLGLPRGVQTVEHLLRAPGSDQIVKYYYAVRCTDEAGNIGEIAGMASPVSNTAKGVATIAFKDTPFSTFKADGVLTDWTGVKPIKLSMTDGSAFKVSNSLIDNDADCSGYAYFAMDKDNLYVAFDITDDYFSPEKQGNTWLNDSPDLFIGLYDWHGPVHDGYMRGDQPDYHIRFAKKRVVIDIPSVDPFLEAGSDFYFEEAKFPKTGWVVEAKIPFSLFGTKTNGGDKVFVPKKGMRIPFDLEINDADVAGSREGLLDYSPYADGNSWADVSVWSYNWIGDQWTVGVNDKERAVTVNSFSLSQNYPNPFNPSTVIKYSIAKAGHVSLKVFDVLGREVAELVNSAQNAGAYNVSFNASKLASGLYIYKLESGDFISSKKMLLIK